MKYLFLLTALMGLMLAGESYSLLPVAEPHVSPVSIEEVLHTLGVPQDPDALVATSAEAVKITFYFPGLEHEAPRFFMRNVKVYVEGNMFKRYKIDPQGGRAQIDLFDGQHAYRCEGEPGTVSRMEDLQYKAFEASVKTFGLIPIIKVLRDPTTEVVYLGCVAGGLNEFSVKTGSSIWTLYSNQQHQITRIEMGKTTIEYSAYYAVQGMHLPFRQRIYSGGRMILELIFTKMDLNASFLPMCFSQESISKEALIKPNPLK